MKKRDTISPALRELHRLLPPPRQPVFAPEKNELVLAEKQLGNKLPSEYGEFINCYGAGTIGDFLHVYVPNCPNSYMDLVKQTVQHRKMLNNTVQLGLCIPFSGIDCVTAWGISDNGDILFGDLEPSNPERVVVFNPRDGDFSAFTGGVCTFLAAILSRQITLPVFPEDFPATEVEFVPLRARQ